jgi:death-on-curing protein
MEPVLLTLDEILEMHEQQIELYGGAHGLRDPGALESAVATPQATFDGEYLHPTVTDMAAAYLFHLTQNHPFIDGNKRVGANAAITFLIMNQVEPAFGEEGLVELVLGVDLPHWLSYCSSIRAIPFASSGASSPLSAASTASFRTAVVRTLNRNRAKAAGLHSDAPGAHICLCDPRLDFRPYHIEIGVFRIDRGSLSVGRHDWLEAREAVTKIRDLQSSKSEGFQEP